MHQEALDVLDIIKSDIELFEKCLLIKNLKITNPYLLSQIEFLPLTKSELPIIFSDFYLKQILNRIEVRCIVVTENIKIKKD
jgi:hypothetical protein